MNTRTESGYVVNSESSGQMMATARIVTFVVNGIVSRSSGSSGSDRRKEEGWDSRDSQGLNTSGRTSSERAFKQVTPGRLMCL